MIIKYKNRKIEKVCTDIQFAIKRYGLNMAERLSQRLQEIEAADSVELMMQFHIGRCHQLSNNRSGQYAVDLVHPYRLVFEKEGSQIQIALIIEIVDYH